MQTHAKLLANNSQHCRVRLNTLLHVVSGVLLRKVLKPVKLLSQQLPTFLLFRDRRSVAQQCWIRLHSSSLALPTLLGPRTRNKHGLESLMGCILLTLHCRSQHCWELFASVCTPLPTRAQQLLSLLTQQCWQLLRPFALRLRQY